MRIASPFVLGWSTTCTEWLRRLKRAASGFMVASAWAWPCGVARLDGVYCFVRFYSIRAGAKPVS